MKKLSIFLSFILILVTVSGLLAEDKKLAQTGLKFLSVAPDARSSAMSGAMTAQEGFSSSLFYNPAGLARITDMVQVSLGQVQWIAGIDYLYGALAYAPQDGAWGVFGLSMLSVDYGDMQSTILADNSQGYLDVGTFRPTAYQIGFGYAKALTNKFSVGGHIKYVKQNLGGGIVDFASDGSAISKKMAVDVLAFDFGILYRTGFKSLNFGMNIRNFSQEIEYIQESFQLPLTFEIGLSMDLLELAAADMERHSVLFSIDATHPRDYSEQIDMGLEYNFLNMVSLRAGYTAPSDEQGVTFGAGLNQNLEGFGLGVDYAYTSFGVFNDVHRFSFQFSF